MPARGGSACSFTPSRVSSEQPAHQWSGPFRRAVWGTTAAHSTLPVSRQVVLRGPIEEGLKREYHPGLLTNIERQAQAVRQRRRMARAVEARGGARTTRSAR